MSAALHLCGPDDLPALLPLVAAFHANAGIDSDDAGRRDALVALLNGTPHGTAYLIGPRRSPVGYIAISFGYSIELGGIDGFIDEFFIRQNIRGRGMGGEVLTSLLPALAENGVKALHLEVSPANEGARKLYARAGFRLRDGYQLMTRKF